MRYLEVFDKDRFPVLRYLIVDDAGRRVFYGGNTGFTVPVGPDDGVHVIHHLDSLLNLIARLANEDGHPYTMQSSLSRGVVPLRPEMMADEIADALGVEVKDILAKYSLLVRPAVETA